MQYISKKNFALLCEVSDRSLELLLNQGIIKFADGKEAQFSFDELYHKGFAEIDAMVDSHWDEEYKVKPKQEFTSIDLFAGAGGFALGLEKAGFKNILLSEEHKSSYQTLKANRPQWQIINYALEQESFTKYKGQVDLVAGTFKNQVFSQAGNNSGFEGTKGSMFFEIGRAIKEIQPKVFVSDNVKGLLGHDYGKTFGIIKNALVELGYTLLEPRVLKAVMYQVPQRRDRLFLVAIRNDLADKAQFKWPDPYYQICTLRDAFYKGILFDQDVPASIGLSYLERKRRVLSLVPMGGNWKDLPPDVQQSYVYDIEGQDRRIGRGDIARRLHIDDPSLTLIASPSMRQTERCHPFETRPLNVREYARIQSFPDDWEFKGSTTEQYKQIGNSVPVNLVYAVGRSLIRLLNDLV